jgi:hypothetical protein
MAGECHISSVLVSRAVQDAWIAPGRRWRHRAAERGGGPPLRWRFTGIAADSLTWRAETAQDEGAT